MHYLINIIQLCVLFLFVLYLFQAAPAAVTTIRESPTEIGRESLLPGSTEIVEVSLIYSQPFYYFIQTAVVVLYIYIYIFVSRWSIHPCVNSSMYYSTLILLAVTLHEISR